MEKKYEFYPMVNKTIKTLIKVITPEETEAFLKILKNYPDLTNLEQCTTSSTLAVLIDELERQHGRWFKGGNNAI